MSRPKKKPEIETGQQGLPLTVACPPMASIFRIWRVDVAVLLACLASWKTPGKE